MTVTTWDAAIAERVKHLAGLGKLPPPGAHPALSALAVLSLIAATGIRHALIPASTIPKLSLPGGRGRHGLVAGLLDKLTQIVAAPSRGEFHCAFSATNWLQEHGFDELILRSVRHSADDSGRSALLAYAARNVAGLMKEKVRLTDQHMLMLLKRDAPDFADDWRSTPETTLSWVLAHEFDSDPTREGRVQRRLQGLRLYAAVAERLREPAITDVIDRGRELAPVLAERLGLAKPHLNALHEAAPSDHGRYPNFEHAVRHLQAHAVPLHQWPGGGRAAQPEAWKTSRWLTTHHLTLIRADYTDTTTVYDAVNAFADDLLAPLIENVSMEALIRPQEDDRPPLSSFEFILHADRPTPQQILAAQDFLACIRRALVGERGPSAFREAAHVWHRRAAAVAALRNEHQTERPGWPPLCAPWTSRCGTIQIVPLTTAKELVEEGNAHRHCVGTYYDACRSGTTQILSLREHGTPTVTAEIRRDPRISRLVVGQFKGFADEVPDDPAVHQAMRDFLRDLRTGAHPLNREPLRAYRQWADQHLCPWGRRPLSLAHARDAFPLYLALLPRGTPHDFDQWCARTGLREGLLAALRFLERQRSSLKECIPF